MLTTETRHLTLQAGDAHRVATRREDYDRQRRNAVLSEYAADLDAAAFWATTRPMSEAQRNADRTIHRHRVVAAGARAVVRLAALGVSR